MHRFFRGDIMQRKHNRLQGPLAAIGFLILILDSRLALEGAASAVVLCTRTVIPALFPFFVLSMLLTDSLKDSVPRPFRILGKTLGIPESAASLVIPALLGGYPVGAKTVGDLYHSRRISAEEAQRLLAFCSNAGPSFLFGMVSGFFPEKRTLWLLWIIHILSAILTAMALPPVKHPPDSRPLPTESSHTDILWSAAKAMALVCCWVVLFRIILTFLEAWFFPMLPDWANVLLSGILELTNGCFALTRIARIPIRFILCSCMLSFGGICVLLQTAAVTRGLSLRFYLLGKLLQTGFSLLLSLSLLSPLRWYLVPPLPLAVILVRKSKIRYGNPELLPV